MSLRLRVALVTALTTLAVVALAGGALVALVARDQSEQLDESLREQAYTAGQQAVAERLRVRIGAPRPSRPAPNLNLVARIVIDGEVTQTFGEFPLDDAETLPLGFTTTRVDGQRWRFLSVEAVDLFPLPASGDIRVEVASPTDEMDETVTDIGGRVVRIGLGAVLLASLGGWFLGSAVLRPLARLRSDAERVRDTVDLEARVADQQGLKEVDELARSLNHMLDRIAQATAETEAALEASRGFAANAAHELRTPLTSMQANLDVLERNPSLDAGARAEVVAELQDQQQRLLRLLSALRLLARGDLERPPLTSEVDLTTLVTEAVERARRRHPDASFSLHVQGVPAVSGWEEGLGVMIDNLLENAALHGRAGGAPAQVTVLLGGDEHGLRLIVDDTGPGIPPEERAVVLERFRRGSAASGSGSGLGLALVAQQAALHGGRVEIATSPTGGARLVVHLPALREDRARQPPPESDPRG